MRYCKNAYLKVKFIMQNPLYWHPYLIYTKKMHTNLLLYYTFQKLFINFMMSIILPVDQDIHTLCTYVHQIWLIKVVIFYLQEFQNVIWVQSITKKEYNTKLCFTFVCLLLSSFIVFDDKIISILPSKLNTWLFSV